MKRTELLSKWRGGSLQCILQVPEGIKVSGDEPLSKMGVIQKFTASTVQQSSGLTNSGEHAIIRQNNPVYSHPATLVL